MEDCTQISILERVSTLEARPTLTSANRTPAYFIDSANTTSDIIMGPICCLLGELPEAVPRWEA